MNTTLSLPKHILYLLLLTAVLGFLFMDVARWMLSRWMLTGSYYSHGFLIPLLSGFLIWRRRHQLQKITLEFAPLGLVGVIVGIIGHFVSTILEIYFTSGLCFLLILISMLYYLYGSKGLKTLAFPLLFLFFMIPIPMIAIANLSIQLKLLTTGWALWLISWFGISTVQDGSTVYFAKGPMIIGDICSGLKSLISLLAFGTFYTEFTSFGFIRKLTIVILSAPIAIISNLVRIIVLCVVAHFFGPEATIGWVHDSSGILIFIVAFALLLGTHKMLELVDSRRTN